MNTLMIEASTAKLEGNALNFAVALTLGFKMVRVPADIDGQNAGEVLAPPDLGSDFDWPRRGRVAATYFLRHWAEDVAQGGPLIFENNISLSPPTSLIHRNGGPSAGWGESGFWTASTWTKGVTGKRAFAYHESLPLVAAMRCLVRHKLGDTVMIPAELVPAQQGDAA